MFKWPGNLKLVYRQGCGSAHFRHVVAQLSRCGLKFSPIRVCQQAWHFLGL